MEAIIGRERHVAVHLMDGYEALQKLLPPQERRGIVLLDSSFDRSEEFARISKALKAAHQRWATGIYAIWYPLMASEVMDGFMRSVKGTGIGKILRLEMRIREPAPDTPAPGCGMLVVNPPWKFDAEARPLLDWIWRALAQDGAGGVKVEWLVPE